MRPVALSPSSEPVLEQPDSALLCVVEVDTLEVAVGAVPSHWLHSICCFPMHFTTTSSPVEQKELRRRERRTAGHQVGSRGAVTLRRG